MERLRILITNDDGIQASGLVSLVRELSSLADVFVAAPDRERSATGHAITMHQPLRASLVELPPAVTAYSISGTPADCVKLAVDKLYAGQIDFVVSGINHGANLGSDVLYSGTVSAALEAVMLGLPAVAFSLAAPFEAASRPCFQWAAETAAHLMKLILVNPWPEDTLLNVNIPGGTRELLGVRVTSLGQMRYKNPIEQREDPWGNTYFWLGGQFDESVNPEVTDVWAVQNGYVSVTPLQFDLTNYRLMDEIAAWELKLPSREEKHDHE
ncbi:MAG: 5'/3'-nucleotidase SurE [Bacillota bacterium]|jgi:5'-nucleotidase